MTTLPPCCSPVAASVVALVLIVALASSTFVPLQTEPADWELKDDGLACKDHRTGNVDVLVAGVSRTSTSSMQQALQGLGYNTTHWLGYMTRYFEFISHFYVGRIKVPNLHKVFEDIPEKGALLDTVVPAMFDDLRRAYPKAKVILTTRGRGVVVYELRELRGSVLALPLDSVPSALLSLPRLSSIPSWPAAPFLSPAGKACLDKFREGSCLRASQ